MEKVFGNVSDYSFTNVFGDRFYLKNFDEWCEEKKRNTYLNDDLRKPTMGYVSYYTKDGGAHVVGFVVRKYGFNVLGKYYASNGIEMMDAQGKFPSHLLFQKVAEIVKDERYDEFLGWSL